MGNDRVMGPWDKSTKKSIEKLLSTVPGFDVDLLTKAFFRIDPDQREFRVDCRILTVLPGAQDIYHFHKKTVALFTVVEGEIDAILNDERIHLSHGQTVMFNTLEKHAFVSCSDKPCILTETRFNVHDDDLYYCRDHEPEGESDTRFSNVF